MQNFVYENEPKARGIVAQLLFENNPALRDEGGGVDRAATLGLLRQKLAARGGQVGEEFQKNRATLKAGQPDQKLSKPIAKGLSLNERNWAISPQGL
jgi:hypothetical protein